MFNISPTMTTLSNYLSKLALSFFVIADSSAAEVLPLPVTTTPLTLTWFTGLSPQAAVSLRSLSEQTAYQVLAEQTGIKIAFQHPPIGAEKERFKLLIVSGKYPDVIETDWSDYPGGPAHALSDRTIIRLNSLIDQYAPNLKKILLANPEVLRQISTDKGDIYCFPLLALDPQVQIIWGPQIRQDWLNRLGLSQPQTIDDWHTVLQAFKTRDPNRNGIHDEIPFSGFTQPGEKLTPGLPAALTMFLGAYGLAPEFFHRDARVFYSPAEPAYKDFLKTMHQWYVEGLLDPDFITQNDKQFDTKMAAGRIGAYASFNGGGLGRYTALARNHVPGFQLSAAAWPSDREGQKHNTFPNAARMFTGVGAAVSSQNKHIVETIRFLDHGYSRQGGLALSFGREGLSYNIVDGQPRYTDSVLHPTNMSVLESILRHARPQSGPLVQDPFYLTQFYALPEQATAVKVWGRGKTDLTLPAIQPNAKDARRFSSLMSDINTYVAEMTTKFILGRESLEHFDEYIARLNAAGLPQAIAYMQDAYDQYRRKPLSINPKNKE